MTFDGEKLGGILKLEQKKSQAGIYTITFDVTANDNRLKGTVTTQREGAKPQTWNTTGKIDVPASEPAEAANGVYEIYLDKCMPKNPGLTTWFRTREGKVDKTDKAWVKACSGMHTPIRAG